MKRHTFAILVLVAVFIISCALEELLTMFAPGIETRYYTSTGEEYFPSASYRAAESIASASLAALVPGFFVAPILWVIAWSIVSRTRRTPGWSTAALFTFLGLLGGCLMSLVIWIVTGGWSPPALLGFTITSAFACLLASYFVRIRLNLSPKHG